VHKPTRVDITVQGEVQRVGYRYIVQDIARKLGVKGYVQNMPDGTVKVIAEASVDIVKKFIEALEVKEPPVVVERVQVTYLKPTGEFQFFAITYGNLTEEMAEGFGTGLKYINLSRHETRQGFHSLGNEVKAMREGMDKNFQEMSGRYDAISENLSQAIRIIQEESVKTRSELIRAVDNLSRLVDELLKERHRRDES